MQQTTITTMSNVRSPVHIKVAHENEFRRFLLTPVSYEKLESTLKSLFNLTNEFQIKFQDDENDWVLLSTDQELVYATELCDTPLRLSINLLESKTTDLPTCEGFKKGGRGGRGCRGGLNGKLGRGGCKSLCNEEKLAKSSSRLAERINQLETKLNSGTLTSEREQVVRWRLAKLQEKLAIVTAMKESLADVPNVEQQPVPGEETTVVPTENEVVATKLGATRGRGRGGRGGCGGWRKAMGEDGEEWKGRKGCNRVRVDPELVAKFRQCKADLQEARESGDAEKINACLEAFKAAKAAKLEARAALRAQAAQACTDEERA